MEQYKFIQALNEELVVALGCTEPIAIALAAAVARKYVRGNNVTDLKIYASTNVIKNAIAVNIPGTGSCGIDLAAALGAMTTETEKSLEILVGLSKEDVEKAKEMIRDGKVSVDLANTSKKLYIEVIAKSDESEAKVIIEDTHTNISLIKVDGQIIKEGTITIDDRETLSSNEGFNIDSIWDFIEQVNPDKIPIIEESINLNYNIGKEGLDGKYGIQVGKTIQKQIEKGFLSDDMINYAMALTAAGSDARMAGSTLKVMSNSGSGNQGITATLPVVAVWEKLKQPKEKLLRAVTLSHLITIYIKSKFGRLSALCGATIAGTGASCGIVYILGGGKTEIKSAIQNMLGNVTGMLCDGAKAGCALKVATCTSAAVQAAFIAMEGISIKCTDGIIENNPEETIENLCTLANEGTQEADKIILNIMLNKATEK